MKQLILVLMILASLGIREMKCEDDNWYDDWYDLDYSWDLFDEGCDE